MQKLARDEAGHIWEVDASGNPVRLHESAPPRRGNIYTVPEAPDPESALKRQVNHLELVDKVRKLSKPDEEDGGLDSATRTYYAQEVLAGAPMPAFGMGKQASANRQAVMQEVARLAGAGGRTGTDLARQVAHYKAGSKQLGTLENMLGTIRQNEQTALLNGQQFIDRSTELPGQTSSPAVNSLVQGLQRNLPVPGHAAIAAHDAAWNTFVNEYAKVVSGSPSGAGTMSDSARHEAMATMRGTYSLDQKKAAFEQMKTDMANRIAAIHQGINEGYQHLTESPGYQVPESTTALAVSAQGGGSKGGAGPAGPAGPGGSPPVIGGPNGGTWKDMPNSGIARTEAATGAVRSEFDPIVAKATENLIRAGKSPDEVNAYLASVGHVAVKPDVILANQAWLKQHPGYGNFVQATKEIPTTAMERLSASPAAAFSTGALNATTLGAADELGGAASYILGGDYKKTRDMLDANKTAIQAAHPGYAFAGDVAGSAIPFSAPGMLLGKGAKLGARVGADAVIGALRGGFENNDNRLGGAVGGGLAGAGGSLAGRAAAIPFAAAARSDTALGAVNTARHLLGKEPLPANPSLSAGEISVFKAANKAGPEDVQGALTEAQSLGIPMSLADTHPELRSLAGAAVRRSPTASQVAETALLPRARGQIDRFGQAVERDLGPVGNVPQLSQDLQAQAQTAAKPLYEQAYDAPPISSPKLDELLNTPFGRQAVARAHAIAANERRDPMALGFGVDANGNVSLNPVRPDLYGAQAQARSGLDAAQQTLKRARVTGGGDVAGATAQVEAAREAVRKADTALRSAPTAGVAATAPTYSPQTLDYVKRGMDDVLEQYRNPVTNRLQLDEAGRAQNGVKNELLSEMDKLNPAYRQARAAYAGPVQSRDAMQFGQDAVSMDPNTLGVALNSRTPEQVAQAQLGFRSGLMDQANKVRYSTNPFTTTLGTPAAEQRLGTLYPGNPGVERMLRQRDLEAQLANTTNDVLGNSKTAQRGIADQSFEGENLPQMAMDVGLNLATGQVPIGVVAKNGGSRWAKDAWNSTLGKRAVAKADEMAPLLLNTNPQDSVDILSRVLAQGQAMRAAAEASRRRAQGWLGPLGAAAGLSSAD